MCNVEGLNVRTQVEHSQHERGRHARQREVCEVRNQDTTSAPCEPHFEPEPSDSFGTVERPRLGPIRERVGEGKVGDPLREVSLHDLLEHVAVPHVCVLQRDVSKAREGVDHRNGVQDCRNCLLDPVALIHVEGEGVTMLPYDLVCLHTEQVGLSVNPCGWAPREEAEEGICVSSVSDVDVAGHNASDESKPSTADQHDVPQHG